jgi:hypothetical protein
MVIHWNVRYYHFLRPLAPKSHCLVPVRRSYIVQSLVCDRGYIPEASVRGSQAAPHTLLIRDEFSVVVEYSVRCRRRLRTRHFRPLDLRDLVSSNLLNQKAHILISQQGHCNPDAMAEHRTRLLVHGRAGAALTFDDELAMGQGADSMHRSRMSKEN